MRFPVLSQSLRLIRKLDPNAGQRIIDIGVQRHTDFLVEVFPDVHHDLFEPATVYHADLEQNYTDAGIKYQLHKIALSDENGILYLHNQSIDGSGNITHSQIKTEKNESLAHLVEIVEIETRRLDTVLAEDHLPDLGYIVKLDVDGLEERIISGGQNIIKGASFVVIETSIGRQDMCSRAAILERLGFRIFDICDNAYYFGQLALVDMVMINNRLRDGNIKFRPWEHADGKVIWSKWQHGFKKMHALDFDDPFAE